MSNSSLTKLTADDAQAWDLPYVESELPVDDTKTNALNRRSDWRYEPPESEEEILPPTAEEIEEIRQAAYQEGLEAGRVEGLKQGYEEGLEQGKSEGLELGREAGHAEGLASAEQDIQSLTNQWQGLINELHQPVLKTHAEVQRQLALLAISLAKAVIRHDVVANEDIILTALREATQTLPLNERQVHIRMHPDDILLVESHFSPETISEQKWHFVVAPEMSRGGCDIATENNAVDNSIERRSKDVLDTFMLQQGLTDG